MGHTPGPWRASEGWPSDIWHVDMPGRKWSVGVSRHDEDYDMPVEEVQANAHLIAAAPALLRELKFAVGVLQDNHIARGVAAALAAIRLAEGGADETTPD